MQTLATNFAWQVEEQDGAVVRVPSWMAPRRHPLRGEEEYAPAAAGSGREPDPAPAEEHAPPRKPTPAMPPPAPVDVKALLSENTTLRGDVAALRNENASLRAESAALRTESLGHAALAASLRAENAALASAIERVRAEVIRDSEQELVALACKIAERVVASELATDPALIVKMVREAHAVLAPDAGPLVVTVGPEIAERVSQEAWAKHLDVPHRLDVDPALPPGAVELSSGASRIDASASGRLERVAEALGVAGVRP